MVDLSLYFTWIATTAYQGYTILLWTASYSLATVTRQSTSTSRASPYSSNYVLSNHRDRSLSTGLVASENPHFCNDIFNLQKMISKFIKAPIIFSQIWYDACSSIALLTNWLLIVEAFAQLQRNIWNYTVEKIKSTESSQETVLHYTRSHFTTLNAISCISRSCIGQWHVGSTDWTWLTACAYRRDLISFPLAAGA